MRSTRLPMLALACFSIAAAGCTGGGTTTPTPTGPSFRFTEAAGTYYKDYTGAQRLSLSAIGADGTFTSATQTIAVFGKMAAPIMDGNTNIYVWGWDRGGAAAGVAPFPDEPNVKFNAVLVVTASAGGTLTGAINLLNGSPAQPVAPVLIGSDTIVVSFPASMLPSTGATPAQYTWNLWPRNGLGGTPAAQIASFIPDNQMASLTSQ